MVFGLAPVPRELWTLKSALFFIKRDTSITMSHRSRAGKPSFRKPASNDIISDSVEQCDT